MAVEVFTFTISVPKGGTAAKPLTFPMRFPVAVLEGIEIYVPAGNNGMLFFGLGSGNTITLPTGAGQYITANNEVIKWSLEHQIDSGNWELFAYNTGTVPHLIHVRFLVTPPGLVTVPQTSGFIEQITIDLGGGGGGGGQPPPGGAGYSFGIETPLTVLDVTQGGSGSVLLVVDEVGTRPADYAVGFVGAPAGLSLTSQPGAAPTAITITATASASLRPSSYAMTVQVSNGGITNTATLTVAVSAGTGTGGGGGGGTPAVSVQPSSVSQGAQLAITATGLDAGTTATLYLGAQTIGSFAADGTGSISAVYTVPTTFPPGQYQVFAYGISGGKSANAVSTPLTVSNAQPSVTTIDVGLGGITHVPVGQQYRYRLQYRAGDTYQLLDTNDNVIARTVADSSGIGYLPPQGALTAVAGTQTWYVIDFTGSAHLAITVTVQSP